MGKARCLATLACLLVAGCNAEVQTKANVSASASADDDHKWETQKETWEVPQGTKPPEPFTPPDAEVQKASVRPPFIGVTPDLTLASGAPRTPVCSCLALAVGAPGDPAFAWRGAVPDSDPESVALAVGSDGVPCDFSAKKGNKGKPVPSPSISAIERSGNDVVVVVEAAHPGRPVAKGAMVQRPGPGGSFVVRGRGRVPFGTQLSGAKGACRIAPSALKPAATGTQTGDQP